MIELNLLPDIKLAYLRAQRTKRFFITVSLLISAAAIALVVLLAAFVYVVQGRHLSNLQEEIDDNLATIQAEENLSEILTVQRQVETLPGLHDDKPIVSRLFDYFTVLVPDDVELDSFELNYGSNGGVSIELIGRSENFKSVNVFADSLKNAQFTSSQQTEETNAFLSVTLDSIGKSQEETVFDIETEVNSLIFDTREESIKLIVPSITSSPSATERPSQLFNRPLEAEAQ